MPKHRSPDAVEMGRRGGRKAAESLTPEQLSERGKLGAAARWGKREMCADEAACREQFPAAVAFYERENPKEWRAMNWRERLDTLKEMKEAGSL